jgi:hypothetical protein
MAIVLFYSRYSIAIVQHSSDDYWYHLIIVLITMNNNDDCMYDYSMEVQMPMVCAMVYY